MRQGTFITHLLLATLLAGSIRFTHLSQRSLWEDELSTWTSIRGTILEGLHYVQMPHPPLYSLSCRILKSADHVPEWKLRLPAALFGVLVIAAGAALGAAVHGRRLGAALAWGLALNAVQVRYSQEARMYTLFTLTATLSMLFWWRWIGGSAAPSPRERKDVNHDRNGPREPFFTAHEGNAPQRIHPAAGGGRSFLPAAAYVVFTVALLYTHYFAGLVLVAQILWLLLVARRREARTLLSRPADWFALFWPMGAAVLLFLPQAIFFVSYVLPNKIAWIQPAPPSDYLRAIGDLVASTPTVWAGAAVLLLCGYALGRDAKRPASSTVVLWGGDRSAPARQEISMQAAESAKAEKKTRGRFAETPDNEETRCGLWLLLLWMLAVYGGLFAYSLLRDPVFVPRYAVSCVVPATALLLAAAERLGGRAQPGLWMGTLILAGVNGLAVAEARIHAQPAPNGLAAIVDHLNRYAGPEDAVVVVDLPFCPKWKNPVEMGFEYYGLKPGLPILRIAGDLSTGHLREISALNDGRHLHIVTILGDVEEALARAGRRPEEFQKFAFEPYLYYVVRGRASPGWPIIPSPGGVIER